METDGTFLKLKITIKDILRMLIGSFICLLGVFSGIGYVIYLIYNVIISTKYITIFLIIKSFSFWKLIFFFISLCVLLRIISIFFIQSLVDLKFFFKYQGTFFYMDMNKIKFYDFETKLYKSKSWSYFEDVGCYKQDSEKLLYKYQIKFSDGDVYNFDLRGTIPTNDFVNKVEEFFIKSAK